MKRTTVNLCIDLLAAVFFVGMIASGYILYFALPPGTNKSLSLWSLTRHQWGQVHFWISIGLLAVLLTHLALHWPWVVATVAQRLGLARNPQSRHRLSGAITLVAATTVLAFFAWATAVSVREWQDPPYPPSEVLGDDGHIDSEGVDTAPDGVGPQVNFWIDVYPILESSCLRCHGPRRAQGGFRVDRREDYFGTNGKGALIIAGKSAESPLIAIVRGLRPDMAMAASHRLPERDVAVLRTWIDAGAEWPEKRDAE